MKRSEKRPWKRSFWAVSLGSIEHSLSIAYISSSLWFPVISFMFWIVFLTLLGIETLAPPLLLLLLIVVFTTPPPTRQDSLSIYIHTSIYMWYILYSNVFTVSICWEKKEEKRKREKRVIVFGEENRRWMEGLWHGMYLVKEKGPNPYVTSSLSFT